MSEKLQRMINYGRKNHHVNVECFEVNETDETVTIVKHLNGGIKVTVLIECDDEE